MLCCWKPTCLMLVFFSISSSVGPQWFPHLQPELPALLVSRTWAVLWWDSTCCNQQAEPSLLCYLFLFPLSVVCKNKSFHAEQTGSVTYCLQDLVCFRGKVPKSCVLGLLWNWTRITNMTFTLECFYDTSNKMSITAGPIRACRQSKFGMVTGALFFVCYHEQMDAWLGSGLWLLGGVGFKGRAKREFLCDRISLKHVLEQKEIALQNPCSWFQVSSEIDCLWIC